MAGLRVHAGYPAADKVPLDGAEVRVGPHHHKEMPDGMGAGDEAIALEEHHARDVEDASQSKLVHTILRGL